MDQIGVAAGRRDERLTFLLGVLVGAGYPHQHAASDKHVYLCFDKYCITRGHFSARIYQESYAK